MAQKINFDDLVTRMWRQMFYTICMDTTYFRMTQAWQFSDIPPLWSHTDRAIIYLPTCGLSTFHWKPFDMFVHHILDKFNHTQVVGLHLFPARCLWSYEPQPRESPEREKTIRPYLTHHVVSPFKNDFTYFWKHIQAPNRCTFEMIGYRFKTDWQSWFLLFSN